MAAPSVPRRRSPVPARVGPLVGAAALAISSWGAGVGLGPRRTAPDVAPSRAPDATPRERSPREAPCGPGALPDWGAADADAPPVCVRLADDTEPPAAESAVNAHHARDGQWVSYDEIPLRPDRSSDYGAYRYPVACDPCARRVVSGYDLDRPDEAQRRARVAGLPLVGHGAVDLAVPRGTPVTVPELEHEQSPPQLLYAGPLFGTSVVTLHALREGGETRDYVVVLGHLEALAPELSAAAAAGPSRSAQVPGAFRRSLRPGQLVGYVGDTGSPGAVHLHLEVRRVRPNVDARKLSPAALIDGANTVVCDPRNVLALK